MTDDKLPAAASERPGQPPADYPAELCWPPLYGSFWRNSDPCNLRRYLGAFTTPEDAAEATRRWSTVEYDNGVIAPLTWRIRETMKDRTLPVWHNMPFWKNNTAIHADHFLHVSTNDATMLAYTQDNAKGQRDIQMPIKPGRYLTRFFSDILTAKEIAFYAAWQTTGAYPSTYDDAKLYPLAFAETPDDIERVYLEGPSSCMSHPASSYSPHIHPTRIYGAGDLAIAYLTDTANDHKPRARALVWPDRKVAGRVYPTVSRWRDDGFASLEDSRAMSDALKSRLKAEGYTFLTEKPDGFNGARMLREEYGGGVVMPYLDNGYKFNDRGDYLIMRSDGDFAADGTNGTALVEDENRRYCENCENGCDADEMSQVYTAVLNGRPRGKQTWCDDCTHSYSFYCHGFNDRMAEELGIVECDGESVCQPWADYNATYCNDTEEYTQNSTVTLEDGHIWSADGFAENGFTCPITGENYSQDDAHPDCDLAHLSPACTADQILAFLAAEDAENGTTHADAYRATLAERDGQSTLDLAA